MTESDDLAWKALPDVAEAAKRFLDPVLASADCGTWEPATWLWRRGA